VLPLTISLTRERYDDAELNNVCHGCTSTANKSLLSVARFCSDEKSLIEKRPPHAQNCPQAPGPVRSMMEKALCDLETLLTLANASSKRKTKMSKEPYIQSRYTRNAQSLPREKHLPLLRSIYPALSCGRAFSRVKCINSTGCTHE
jgi:hypothetical protein